MDKKDVGVIVILVAEINSCSRRQCKNYEMMVTKIHSATYFTNITKLSPTYFIVTIYYIG